MGGWQHRQRSSTAAASRSPSGAYTLWGLFPAFWPLLAPAAPVEVLAHRIGWTAVLMVGVLSLLRGWPALRTLSVRGWLMTTSAAVLIAANWGLYIYAVFAGHVVEAALGYFISPLFSVLLGVLVLRERLRRVQVVALGLATAAVVVISVESDGFPWVAIMLAATFGLYSLIKRTVPLPTTASLTAEGLVLGPVAIGVVVWMQVAGSGTLTGFGPWHVLLLVAAGPVTAIPLLLYGAAALRVPLTTIGVLMYLNPTLQFLWGVVVLREEMPALRWIGFALVWTALVVFTADLLRRPTPRESGHSVARVGTFRARVGTFRARVGDFGRASRDVAVGARDVPQPDGPSENPDSRTENPDSRTENPDSRAENPDSRGQAVRSTT